MINDILMYVSGFLWGWLFLSFILLAGKLVDFLNESYISNITKESLWVFKSITFIAGLMFLSTVYWTTSQAFIRYFFLTSGREFAISVLVGFLAFIILPRIEGAIKKK